MQRSWLEERLLEDVDLRPGLRSLFSLAPATPFGTRHTIMRQIAFEITYQEHMLRTGSQEPPAGHSGCWNNCSMRIPAMKLYGSQPHAFSICWNRWQDKQRSPHSTPSTCTVSVLVYFGYQFGNRLFITGALVKTLKLSPLNCIIVFAKGEKGWLHAPRRPILRDLTEVYAPIATWAKMHGQPPEIFVVERA